MNPCARSQSALAPCSLQRARRGRGCERRRPRSLRGSGGPSRDAWCSFWMTQWRQGFLAPKVADWRWIVLSLASRAAPSDPNAPTQGSWLATKRSYRRGTAYTLFRSQRTRRKFSARRLLVGVETGIRPLQKPGFFFFFSPSVAQPLDGSVRGKWYELACLGHGEDGMRECGVAIGTQPGNANSLTGLC